MKPLNLTPHDVVVIVGDEITRFPRSDQIARLISDEQHSCPTVSEQVGVPVYSAPVFGDITGLPNNTMVDIIVSLPVAQYLQHTNSWCGRIFSPDTGPGQAVRNQDGQIIGVQRLILWK